MSGNDYSFTLSIDSADFSDLYNNGYYFALKKATDSAGGKPLQWISELIQAENINIGWSDKDFGVFFTTTDIEEGAIIQLQYPTPAKLDRVYVCSLASLLYIYSFITFGSYIFQNNTFSENTDGQKGGINIGNLSGSNGYFGITQETNSIQSPLVVSLVLNKGNVAWLFIGIIYATTSLV